MRHDDEKDPGTAALAAVAGLARAVEALTRDVEAMKKGLQQSASATEVTRLARIVTELGEVLTRNPQGSKGKDKAEAVRSWLTLAEDAAAVETAIREAREDRTTFVELTLEGGGAKTWVNADRILRFTET